MGSSCYSMEYNIDNDGQVLSCFPFISIISIFFFSFSTTVYIFLMKLKIKIVNIMNIFCSNIKRMNDINKIKLSQLSTNVVYDYLISLIKHIFNGTQSLPYLIYLNHSSSIFQQQCIN